MKRLFTPCVLVSIFFTGLEARKNSLADQAKTNKPLLVVVLMVKNEAEAIIPTLETYLTDAIKEGKPDSSDVAYIVYDTGSTDGTELIAEEFFKEHGIKNYTIPQEPFIDFSTSRNRALTIARESYPSSPYILFPDAEWYMHNFEDLLTFCRQELVTYQRGAVPPPYYHIRMARAEFISLTPRLFLTHDTVVFEGVVHECPTKLSERSVPSSVYFELGTSKYGADKSRQRWLRDRELLLNDLLNNPTNARTALYLGLTELWLENNESAYLYLKRRIHMRSFPQEEYEAMYNLGEATERLSYEMPDRYTWDEALGYYMKAYTMRPQRAEPLIKIAHHYLEQKEYAASYLFAKRAIELPIPSIEEEVHQVLLELYTFYRWEILSRAAWYMKDYELGEYAAKQAIEAHPNKPHLYSNLSCYWDRKTK